MGHQQGKATRQSHRNERRATEQPREPKLQATLSEKARGLLARETQARWGHVVVPLTLGPGRSQTGCRLGFTEVRQSAIVQDGEASQTPPASALPDILVPISPHPFLHLTPTTVATIILAGFALAMWTVGWFLLYFVALSNIS